MNLLQSIHPAKPLRYLKWFDILIITVLMFGEFIIRSTQRFMESLSPSTLTSVAETTTNLASDGAAYSSNFNFQLMMLGITFLYLVIRNYDFKQDLYVGVGLFLFGYPLFLLLLEYLVIL